MARLRRLDAELVRRGLARSRGQAGELVAAGRVDIAGTTATKAATQVDPAAAIVVRPDPQGAPDYVSRGGHKLAGALEIDDPGKDALDLLRAACAATWTAGSSPDPRPLIDAVRGLEPGAGWAR